MNRGMGVMLSQLSGYGDTAKVLQVSIGKNIAALELEDNALKIKFDDELKIALYDAGQSCCEKRWMHTDDDLSYFVGSTLTGFRLEEVTNPVTEKEEYTYGCKDQQFLITDTSKGSFTCVNYNEHNGYYGGFAIEAEDITKTGG